MKLAVLLTIVAIGMTPISANAASNEFGYKLLPEKLLEYTEGTLQIFVEVDNLMIPQEIVGLKATSSDSSIIKIIGMDVGNDFLTNIKIQALKPGEAKIALAAPGFTSKEISIKVYDNNNFPTQIQMKVTPNTFPVDGPKYGYIGVELLTTSGLPSKAETDTIIKFSTPNNDIIKLEKDEVLIKKGEYFALNQFTILGSGEPIIFAESEGMKKISSFIQIQEAAEPYKIQIYAYPSTFTSYSNPNGYLIIQLQDNDGVPVIAEKDISVSLTSTNPRTDINTSTNFDEVIFQTKDLKIEKGSYWAYTPFKPRPDLGGFTNSDFQTYTISASVDDYLSTSTPITVIHERVGGGDTGQVKGGILIGEGPAIFSPVPFLTTGKNELMGIVYLEATVPIIEQLDSLVPGSSTVFASITDEATIPVMTDKDVELNIASSNLNTVNFVNPIVKQGTNAAVVFGNTGTVAPKDCTMEFYLTDNEGVKTITGNPYGPVKDSLSLKIEPLIPKILAEADFPLLGYLNEAGSSGSGETSCYSSVGSDDEDENGRFGVTQFTKDAVLTFSADDYVDIESAIIKQNQPYALLSAKSNKVGTTTFESRGSDLQSTVSLVSHTTDPTSFGLSYAKSTLPGTTTLSVIQVLDSAGNPVYAKEDIEITLVSNNENVLKVPSNLVISKDDYRTFFEISTFSEGTSEIAILSEDLPLAKFDLNVKGIHPKLNMNIAGSGLVNEAMRATLSVSYPGVGLTAEELDVKWIVSNAEILNEQTKTNDKGQASIELISKNPTTTSIRAVVNGIGISNAEQVSSYTFAYPEGYVETKQDDSLLGGIGLSNSNIIFFTIPGAAAGVFLFLKRTNRLEEITGRLPLGGLGEKFEEMKERISEMRERDR
jgi:hypothetical protein